MIVRELVTKLGFSLNKTGLTEAIKGLQEVSAKAVSTQNQLKKSLDFSPELTAKKNKRFEELLSYKEELSGLTADERKQIALLNSAEKQSIKEIAQEKKQLDLEEKRRLKELNKERRFAGIKRDLQSLNSFVNRTLFTAFATASTSFGFSYKEFKKYQENRRQGVTIKTSLTSSQLKQFDDFDKKVTKFRSNVVGLRNSFSTALLPLLTPLIDNFNKWNDSNKKIIDTNIKGYAEQLGVTFRNMANNFVSILPKIQVIVDAFGGLESILYALVGIKLASWGAGIVTALSSPLGAVVAVTAAVAALYDEIKTTINGGDSLINSSIDSLTKKSEEQKNAGKKKKGGQIRIVNLDNGTERFADLATGEIKSKADPLQFLNAAGAYRNPVNKITQTNNVGGIKIVIENRGTIDESVIPQFTDMIQEKINEALNDSFSLTKADIVS